MLPSVRGAGPASTAAENQSKGKQRTAWLMFSSQLTPDQSTRDHRDNERKMQSALEREALCS